MKKNDLFIPMQPIDWTELSSGLTKLAADIPLATEEEHDYEDYKPLDCFASREEPALSKHPKKKNWKKRLRKAEEKFQAKQQELTHAQKELESWQLHAAGLLSAVAQERRARNQAELENTSRQVALIMSEAIRRGQAAEAFQDLAFGGTDALLSRGRWLFQGGNLDRTVPHRKPRPDGYVLPDKNWRILDDQKPENEHEEG